MYDNYDCALVSVLICQLKCTLLSRIWCNRHIQQLAVRSGKLPDMITTISNI